MTYHVTATRWEHGWELHIEGVGVTQSRVLADAETMVRDYLAQDDRPDADSAAISVEPVLMGVEVIVAKAREQTLEAQDLQRQAALLSRDAVRELRNLGLSTADVATIMGVTKGRISQLSGSR